MPLQAQPEPNPHNPRLTPHPTTLASRLTPPCHPSPALTPRPPYPRQLQDSGLGLRAAIALASALPRCGLEELWVGGNPLGPDGAKWLAQALPQSTTLKRLWLDGTGLDDSAAGGLAAALTAPRCPIEHLWLGGNALGDAGGLALAAALADSGLADSGSSGGHLRKLWLDHSASLSSKGAAVLVKAAIGMAADGGGGFDHLWLGGRAIGPADARALEAIVDGKAQADLPVPRLLIDEQAA